MDCYKATIVYAKLAIYLFMEDDMILCISSKFGTSAINLSRFVRELGGERESGVSLFGFFKGALWTVAQSRSWAKDSSHRTCCSLKCVCVCVCVCVGRVISSKND